MKLRLMLCLLLLSALLPFSAVLAQDDACPDGPVADDAPVITFGLTASQTGRLSREGTEMLNGYNLWLDWANNEAGGINVDGVCHRADLRVYDDLSGSLHVEARTTQLIEEDGVDFLFGPYGSDLVMIASEIANAGGVLMVQGNGAAETLYDRDYENFFGVLTSGTGYTVSGIELAYAQGARTAVLAFENASFAASVSAGAEAAMEALGIEILASETYPVDTKNLDTLFSEFAALEPDLFVGGGHYADSILIAQTAKASDFNPDAMLIIVGPSIPAFTQELGQDANFIWGASQWERSLSFEDPWFGSTADYAERYENRYGVPPSYQATSASAAALVLHIAIETAGSTDTAAVSAALHDLEIETFYGPVDFDETGRNIAKAMVATQIQDGEIVVIAPADVAVAEPQYPAPAWSER